MESRGLGLSARGHVRLVVIYASVLLALAAFGAGRLREVVPRIAAAYTAMQHNLAVARATRAAFAQAIRANARVPKPNPVLPHRIAGYPVLALRHHQEGGVLLNVLVLPNGEVGDVRVLRSSGFSQLDAAALTGVGGWHYVPAVRDHHPVSAWVKVDIRFRTGGPRPKGSKTGP